MSINLAIANKHVSIQEIFDGRLERYGIVEATGPENYRYLTDGSNFLAVCGTDDVQFTYFASNGLPLDILAAIGEAFDAEIVSEYEPKYYGFNTIEEWRAYEEELAKEDPDGAAILAQVRQLYVENGIPTLPDIQA